MVVDYRRPPVPHLIVNPTVIDYGRVVAEGQVEWKKFTLTNDGAIPGPYVLKPSSSLIELSTYNGTIVPHEIVDIKVIIALLSVSIMQPITGWATM